jgi:hypothetical protein
MEQLEQPAAEKAKEAEKEAHTFTCKACTSPYTDGSGGAASGSRSGKRNYGFCSSTCRTAKKAPRKCEHNRRKDSCKDCGTGYCEHNRQKGSCKDCGTGYCEHSRRRDSCKDCGTGCRENNCR